MSEKNPFTTAFEELSKTELTGKEKTEKFKELARLKKGMSSDEPRSNVGDYDESKYNPKRKKYIAMSRRQGLTSAEDMEKAAGIKKAARRASYLKKGLKAIPGFGVAMEILEPTELGASERMSDELKSELNQMEEYKKGGRVKKAKGGLMRGMPKVAKRAWK